MTVHGAETPRYKHTLIAVCIIALCSFILSSCADDNTGKDSQTRQLEILAPYPGFIPISPQGDWAISGNADAVRSQMSMVDRKGRHAMQIKTGARNFVIVRRTQAMMLATPFLRWDWLMDAHGIGTHPVRLVIGFHGGNPKGETWGSTAFKWLGSQLPPHDRAISVTWEDSALQRGNILYANHQGNIVPRYVVRGGRENVGRWFSEFLDLSELYTRTWPNDDFGQVRIMFIGMAVAKSKKPTAALITNVMLTR
jgi:hypothetical protein